MRVSFSPGYCIPLPEGHPFPIDKFSALQRILLREGLISIDEIIAPEQARWEDLARVHTRDYLEKLRSGSFAKQELRRLGLPWSPALVKRSRLAVQGTLNALRFALEDGIAANLAGGTHHAFADRGEGFCVLNDVAVAIRTQRRCCASLRALVIDLDVHQGNGTASIFAQDEEVFTFSMHGAKNYPFRKERSSCDVAVPDGADDVQYLAELGRFLPRVVQESRPEAVFYLAGVDSVEGDRFGRLALTRNGLHERDRMVLETTSRQGVPVVLLLSGGYARTPLETADLHAVVHREARFVYG